MAVPNLRAVQDPAPDPATDPAADAAADTPADAASDAARRWDGRLFGPFRLLGPDGSNATPAGRKARALIAFLVVAGDDGATRDRLAGLLWSERGEDQARASLRQTLHEIRTLTAGAAPLIAVDRSRARLVADRLASDVLRFQVAARDGDPGELAALVGERPLEFLADLDGIDPAFDDWMAGERAQRRDARHRTLLVAAERALDCGNASLASGLADHLLACDATDEAVARLAMEIAQRTGDRQGVRRVFTRVQDALRRDIGVDVSDETLQTCRRLMEAPLVRGVGPTASVAPDVEEAHCADDLFDAVAHPAPADDIGDVDRSAPQPHGSGPAWLRSRRATVALCGLVVLAVGGGAWWRTATSSTSPVLLLVEPMRTALNDGAARALGIGLSAELSRMIVGDSALTVRDADRAGDDSSSRRFAIATDGTSHDGALHVDLEVIADAGGPILWSTTFVRPVGDMDALREQMAAKVADVITCAIGDGGAALARLPVDSLKLLLGACDQRHRQGGNDARLLEQFVKQAPDVAHGWALLSVAASNESSPANDEATAAAKRAIELDPHDGLAYFGRAQAQPGIARWSQRVAILREGVRMDQDGADPAFGLSLELAAAGYWHDAIAESERAFLADPLSPAKAKWHAAFLGMSDEGPVAQAAFRAARRRFFTEPDLAYADLCFSALVGDSRRAADIVADPNRGFNLMADRAAMWRALIASRAEPSAAHDADAEKAFVTSMQAHPKVFLSSIEKLAFLDRVDEAYAYADRLAASELADDDTFLLFTVVTKPLRADPRFMTLAARLGLVAVWQQAGRWPDFCSDPALGYDCRVEADRATSSDPRPLVAHRAS